MTQALRVGLLLDGRQIPRHWFELIEQVAQSEAAELSVIVIAPRGSRPPAGGALFLLYAKYDRRQVNPDSDPMELLDASPVLSRVPTVESTSYSTAPEPRPDVFLDLREGTRVGHPPLSARCGVWSLRYTRGTEGCGEPECFWEVHDGNHLSGGELVARSAGDGEDLILSRGVFATSPGWSWKRNQRSVLLGTDALVVPKLAELRASGWDHVRRRAGPIFTRAQDARGRRTPTNLAMARWLIPLGVRKARGRLARRPVQPEWRLAIRQSNQLLPDRQDAPSADFTWIEAKEGRWYADPFLVAHEGATWAFFEDADRRTGHGRISAAPVIAGGLEEPVIVMTRSEHLSYPHVFADGGDWFMIPESYENRTVELWRCRRFPGEWFKESVLLEGPWVDSALTVEGGTYWLFSTRFDPRSQAMQLWLFMADALTGPWRSHPENPISADVRNARGAGAIFRHNGTLYRPSQDCSGRYGRAFSLNQVIALTPDRYEERSVRTVEPMPGFVGTHTYARCGDIEMIDGCVLAPMR